MSNLKIQLCQINSSIGDFEGNFDKILIEFRKAEANNCDLAIFCEMTITGYPCEDLWQKEYFIKKSDEKIAAICEATKSSKCAILVGAPTISINRNRQKIIHNSALLIENGKIIKTINKISLPNYGVFDEKRYFKAENHISLVEFHGQTLAILICEDLWDNKNLFLLQEQVCDSIISINSSPYTRTKYGERLKIAQNFSKSLKKPLIYVNQVGGQDSLTFDGSSFALNSKGRTILQMAEFAEDSTTIEVKKNGDISTNHENKFSDSEISRSYSSCVLGLKDYIHKNGFKKILLGMSGGMDSALVATMAVDALGSENVALYALPSRYNSDESLNDAKFCAKNLNAELKVISINEPFKVLLNTIGETKNSLTQENLQSRIRGNILMALSNDTGALLLSTGNKSELAMGYATIYGDMCGSFNPIKDLYKTEVFEISRWRNKNIPEISLHKVKNVIPENIITKPPSAELREGQKDSDSLPEYDILDDILFQLIEEQKSVEEIIKSGHDKELVKKISRSFYFSEYKRKQSVIGPKLSNVSFDKDRRYPITNKFIN